MSELEQVNTEFMQTVIQDFHSYVVEKDTLVGGKVIAKNLSRYVLNSKPTANPNELHHQAPFAYLLDLSESELLDYLHHENQQTVAAILSSFETETVVKIFEKFKLDQAESLNEKMKNFNKPNQKLLEDYHVYLYGSIQKHKLNQKNDQKISDLNKVLENLITQKTTKAEDLPPNIENPQHKKKKKWLFMSMFTLLFFSAIGLLNSVMMPSLFAKSIPEKPFEEMFILPSFTLSDISQNQKESVSEWFDTRHTYEQSIKESVSKKLYSLLGHDHFKVDVQADVASIQNHQVTSVHHVYIVISLDEQEEIFKEKNKKEQLFYELATGFGYMKDRESMQINDDAISFCPIYPQKAL